MAAQKVCVVFGFGPGVGAACARRWIEGGYKVAILARKMDKLQAFEEKHSADVEDVAKGYAKGYACDVTNRSQMKEAVSKIEVDLGPIETVIYNAGSAVFKTYDQMTEADFDSCVAINARGLLTAAQLICPKMVENGGGNVAITGATASLRGKPFTAAFAAGKAAQRMLAQSLARDLGPKNVHVYYVINDGLIDNNENPGEQKDGMIDPNAMAETYWNLSQQPKNCWTQELDLRPNAENW